MDENTIDLNAARRVKNIQKAIKIFESQLAAVKKSIALLAEHKEFSFFNSMCHELAAENHKIAGELLRMRVRLQDAKERLKQELK